MQGHAGSNVMPVMAANRIGLEEVTPSEANGGQQSALNFYGSSFITDGSGEILKSASRDKEEILIASFDRAQLANDRLSWGLFRDRRSEMYDAI